MKRNAAAETSGPARFGPDLKGCCGGEEEDEAENAAIPVTFVCLVVCDPEQSFPLLFFAELGQ